MSASPATDPKPDGTLYADQYATLTRDGREVVLESTSWCTRGARIVTFVLLAVVAVVCAALWRYVLHGGAMLPIALPFAIWALVTVLLGVKDFVGQLFPRRTVFDLDSRTCTFSNIPGFDRAFPFSRIETIDILDFGHYGDGVLCLKIRGKLRRLQMHGIVGDREYAVAVKIERAQLAAALAKLLDRPVRVVYRKGRVEPIAIDEPGGGEGR